MKQAVFGLSFVLLACVLLVAAPEEEETNACQFSLTVEPGKPTVAGPENVVPLVHVIHQPDSPLEILAVDFQNSYLYVDNERFVWERRCKARVRNRSDKVIENARITELLSDTYGGVGSGGSLRGRVPQGLQPGQETEITACGGKGYGGAKDNTLRITMAVSWVDLPGCRYYPSLHIPHRLGVSNLMR